MTINLTRRLVTAGCLLGTALMVPVVTAPAAQASCPVEIYYSVPTSKEVHWRAKGTPIFKDGPGGQIEITTEVSGTVTASITVGAEAELSGVIAKAKATVSGTIARSVTARLSHTYRRNITNGKYGNAQLGSWARQVTWKKWQDTKDCKTKLLASGTAMLPTEKIGVKYWETSS